MSGFYGRRGGPSPAWSGASVALLALLAIAAPARADFTPATLLSGTELIQFDQASAPALSADGRYAVFRGSLGEVPGIYRRELATGKIELVAGADATAPSISANGRYIAFTSPEVLVAAAKPGEGCPQVYVRDMEAPAGESGYELASALDGTSTGLSYASCAHVLRPAEEVPMSGSQAAPGVALSADGQKVAFAVLSYSNLTRGAGCPLPKPLAECPPATPPSQVAVRDLTNDTTTLVSATPEGQATPGGGAFPSFESESCSGCFSHDPLLYGGSRAAGSTAALSADGSTVAWFGTNVPAQIPGSAAEIDGGMRGLGGGPSGEVEPLWRRVGDGTGALTRRLLAGAGLSFFAKTYQGETEVFHPVLGGALGDGEGFLPPIALSADGRTAAMIANTLTVNNASTYYGQELSGFPAPPADAYAVRITDDPEMLPQVTPLTATPSFLTPRVFQGGVEDVAISPDGSRVAFNTQRRSFALSSPESVSPPAPAGDYTYEVNLALGTLQRVTSTPDGSAPDGEAGLLSFSGDGQSLAFASSASNLFYGDAITSASEVYLVHELPTSEAPTEQSVAPAPALAPVQSAWILNATAAAQADGSVLVQAQTPGAGRLQVKAAAQLPAARDAARGGKRSQKKRAGFAVPARTVAHATALAESPSTIQLRLVVGSRYRALLTRRGGLYCIVRVSFTAPGHAPLVREIPVTFRRTARAPARRKARVR